MKYEARVKNISIIEYHQLVVFLGNLLNIKIFRLQETKTVVRICFQCELKLLTYLFEDPSNSIGQTAHKSIVCSHGQNKPYLDCSAEHGQGYFFGHQRLMQNIGKLAGVLQRRIFHQKLHPQEQTAHGVGPTVSCLLLDS